MEERRLTAILFSDISGYSTLMGENEEKALALLEKNRKIHRFMVRSFHGRVIDEIGDGTFACFNSAMDAVQCAVEVLRASHEDPRLRLHIGIHLAEVVISGNKVYGDGVNLASRIQSSAGEEEILVSEDVYRNIRNHEGIQAEFLGEKSFKNIKENTGIYRISASESYIPVLQPEEVQKGISREREPKPKLKKDKLLMYTVVVLSLIIIIGVVINRSRDHRPPDRLDQSVAVLPFKNYSGDKAYDYFTDGMTEEVINSLSKISGLKVISRTSVEQYKNSTKDTPTIAKELGVSNLLEGSIRKDSNRVKVTVQLIQARSRFHLWSDEYERNLSGIFSVQTEIAQKVAGVLAVVLTEREKTLIENRPSISITAYDFYMKARDERMYYEFGKGEGHLENAGDLYRKALRVDSTFAPAYAGLGWIYSFKHGAGEYFKSNYLDSAKMLAEKALKLDINCEDAYCLLGYYDYQHGNFESALKELDKAI